MSLIEFDHRFMFEASHSEDGQSWTRLPRGDSRDYVWCSGAAKQRSFIENRYERVVNSVTGIWLVTFFKGRIVYLEDQRGEVQPPGGPLDSRQWRTRVSSRRGQNQQPNSDAAHL